MELDKPEKSTVLQDDNPAEGCTTKNNPTTFIKNSNSEVSENSNSFACDALDKQIIAAEQQHGLCHTSFDSQSWGNNPENNEVAAPDKTNNPQDEFSSQSPDLNQSQFQIKTVHVENMYDFKNIVAQAACKGEQGLRLKKQNLVAIKANVSNKLEHIFNIAKNLMCDVKSFYEGPTFLVGNEPSLSEKISVFRCHLEDIQESCNKINILIDEDIKSTTDRLKSTRSLQDQVNRDIQDYVKQKLAQFDNVSIAGFDAEFPIQEPQLSANKVVVAGPGYVSTDNWPANLVSKMKLENQSLNQVQPSQVNNLSQPSVVKSLSSNHHPAMLEEEFKMVGSSINSGENKKVSQLQQVKDTIRKLPMFETYDQAVGEVYDFEWPSQSQLKQITQVKQMRLKEIRYQQDTLGVITAIKFICHDISSPFFSASLDKKQAPIVLNCHQFYDNKDGHYRVNNIAGRIEFNNMISNIYFNEDKSGIQRIGTKRGNGPLSHINLEEGEEIIGIYGNFTEKSDRSSISNLGFIVWKPNV